MKNFIVFFTEKEGTSAVVRLLDNLAGVSVIHQVDDKGWEPFDAHQCGPMSLDDLERCLDLVYGPGDVDMDALNGIYTRTAVRPLAPFSRSQSVGFKMRFVPPQLKSSLAGGLRGLENLLSGRMQRQFEKRMIALLARHDVTVFVAVRQDVFRWALSKYHGDGTGKTGHLQFKLAKGELRREEIPRIEVSIDRLGAIVSECERTHEEKRALLAQLRRAGVRAHPMLYEEFLEDKHRFFQELLTRLDVTVDAEEITKALAAGTSLEKVHSEDIAEFVVNHQEVAARFADRFVSWA
jgi:hypothetical protein